VKRLLWRTRAGKLTRWGYADNGTTHVLTISYDGSTEQWKVRMLGKDGQWRTIQQGCEIQSIPFDALHEEVQAAAEDFWNSEIQP
jgi:hypothetical protein